MALSNTVQLRDGMSNVLSRIASNLSAVKRPVRAYAKPDRTGRPEPGCIHNLTAN